MKNFKRIGVVLSLAVVIGLGSFVYASDFTNHKKTNTHSEFNHHTEFEKGYDHCCEGRNKLERNHKIRKHGRRHRR